MNYNEVLTNYADTINRIKEELGKTKDPFCDYVALFDEYCQNPKNRQLGKMLQEAEQRKTSITDWKARLDNWARNRKRKPSGKAKKQFASLDILDLITKQQQLKEELQQVNEELEQRKFDDFTNAVKTLLRDGVTKNELINRINDLAE